MILNSSSMVALKSSFFFCGFHPSSLLTSPLVLELWKPSQQKSGECCMTGEQTDFEAKRSSASCKFPSDHDSAPSCNEISRTWSVFSAPSFRPALPISLESSLQVKSPASEKPIPISP